MGTWSRVDVGGKPAEVFEPSRWAEQRAVLLFLHGHGLITLRDNPVYTALLEQAGWGAICPSGARSWWGHRICREFDPLVTPVRYLRETVLPFIASTWQVTPPNIPLLGVSMGGQGALRLAYWYPQQFPVVAALAPAIDFQIWHGLGLPLDEMYESREEARQDTATLHIHPLNWPPHQLLVCDPTDRDWFEGVDRLASKLSSTGIPFEADLTTSHGGHSWEYFNHMAPRVMQFLVERVEQERRRLPVS